MPFKSKAQQAYLYANNPELAKKFAQDTTKKQMSKLPEHVKNPKQRRKDQNNGSQEKARTSHAPEERLEKALLKRLPKPPDVRGLFL